MEPKENHITDYSNDTRFLSAPKETRKFLLALQNLNINCFACSIVINHEDETFDCKECYTLFHLKCIKPHLKALKIGNFWKSTLSCLKCQKNTILDADPYYNCFCGKFYTAQKYDNNFDPFLVPHGCGTKCNKQICKHLYCSIPCHPGPHEICNEQECKDATEEINSLFDVKVNLEDKEPLTTVINIKGKQEIVGSQCEKDQKIIYCGRRNALGGWNLTKSIWANPFKVTKEETNDVVCQKYEEYIRKKPNLKEKLKDLIGKKLACWCVPKPCHCEVLIKLMKEYGLIK